MFFVLFIFQDLNFNFHSVIIPEALTAFQAEEPSVLSMLQDLDDLVTLLPVTLDVAIINVDEKLAATSVNDEVKIHLSP